MRCGKSSCNLLIISKKSYLLKNFVHYIKKMLNFHSLYSDCVWYKKLRELAFVHYIANFTISRFVITKFGCTCRCNDNNNTYENETSIYNHFHDCWMFLSKERTDFYLFIKKIEKWIQWMIIQHIWLAIITWQLHVDKRGLGPGRK